MLHRGIEMEQLTRVEEFGTGVICYSPMAEGVLTGKYLDTHNPIPSDSRAAQDYQGLTVEEITTERLATVRGTGPRIARGRRAMKVCRVLERTARRTSADHTLLHGGVGCHEWAAGTRPLWI
jgi:aryl-alcohol dehydrogenase-like predicted oxidoreductase